MQDWAYDGMSIMHKDKKYFTVIGVNVEIGNREVLSWDQPMIKPAQEGIIAFLVKEINGIYHFWSRQNLRQEILTLWNLLLQFNVLQEITAPARTNILCLSLMMFWKLRQTRYGCQLTKVRKGKIL